MTVVDKRWRYIPPRFRTDAGPTQASLEAREPAPERAPVLRVGFFVRAGSMYSGGRLMLTMHAVGLARAGAEVYMVTDGTFTWQQDFAWPPSLKILKLTDPLPPDLDVIITDCRGPVAQVGAQYKERSPQTRLVVVAFETPNWPEKLDPLLASKMHKEDFLPIERKCDELMAISREGAKYLSEFYHDGKPISVAYPAMNTDGIDQAMPMVSTRPYAVFCGRPVRHKHTEAAVEAVQALPDVMDLVMIGGLGMYSPATNSRHRIIRKAGISEVEKFAWMKGAQMVLAPSTFEGFGLVPGESLLCGTPCVVYDLPVLHEAYGDDIVYAKHNDPKAFVAAVKEVASKPKPDLRAAAARVRARFGIDGLPERVQRLPYHAVTRKALSVSMICYATPAPLVEACLRSVYDCADDINIAYGPVPFWRDYPEGGTLEAIRNFPDPDGKLRIEARPAWPDKRDMWAWCSDRSTGNVQLITGADMIWQGLDKWLAAGHQWATPRWVNFWHDLQHWIYGPDDDPGRWGERMFPFGSLCRHRLFGWYRHSYQWKKHPEPVDAAGKRLWTIEGNREAAEATPETVCYHLGHILGADLMAQKHGYYAARDKNAVHGKYWREWDGRPGRCGDGIVAPVEWELPEAVIEAARRLVEAG